MTSRKDILKITDRQEAETAIHSIYTNPNTIRIVLREWIRRHDPSSLPPKRSLKDNVINLYLASTPIATIIARRKLVRHEQREKRRAELNFLLTQLNLADQEDEEEDVVLEDEEDEDASTNDDDEEDDVLNSSDEDAA